MAGCKQDTVRIKLGDGAVTEVQKNSFGIYVVLIDFLCVFIFIGFVQFLDNSQREYAARFEEETIEMSDFCVRFQNMPKDGEFRANQSVFKAILWDKMTKILA